MRPQRVSLLGLGWIIPEIGLVGRVPPLGIMLGGKLEGLPCLRIINKVLTKSKTYVSTLFFLELAGLMYRARRTGWETYLPPK